MKELEDYNWFPSFLRNYQTEFIGFVVAKFDVYNVFVKHLNTMSLQAKPMLDLCSGSGQPAIYIFKKSNCFTQLILSDKYPNSLQFHDDKIVYEMQSTNVLTMHFDATNYYTLFNSFHHFTDDEKIMTTQKIYDSGATAFFVEILEPTISCFFKVLFMTTIGCLLLSPFVKPFSLKRINQIADVEIDKINKPYLPIPSCVLKLQQARVIVLAALVVCLALALCISLYLFAIVALASAIGWAYSMPPLYLKKHHITAALAITMVRGVLLNAGGFMVFNYLVNNSLVMPQNVKILTLFIIAFSIVISWFKDLSDIKGDTQYNIKTFAILYTPKTALIVGNTLIAIAYLITIYIKCLEYFESKNPLIQTKILLYGHIILLVLFISNAFSIKGIVDIDKHKVEAYFRKRNDDLPIFFRVIIKRLYKTHYLMSCFFVVCNAQLVASAQLEIPFTVLD
eukprot:gene227-412_t